MAGTGEQLPRHLRLVGDEAEPRDPGAEADRRDLAAEERDVAASRRDLRQAIDDELTGGDDGGKHRLGRHDALLDRQAAALDRRASAADRRRHGD